MSQINTVLYVEDSDLDMEKVTRIFRKLEIKSELVRARDGVEALEIMRGKGDNPALPKPYVVLLDLNMPRMGGLELLGELRKDADLQPTPVFVLTTSDHRDDVEAAYTHNVCGYFVKTADRKTFVDTVDSLRNFWESCLYPER